MSWRAALPALLVAALIVLFAMGLGKDPGLIPSPFIGQPAPGFDLEALRDPTRRVRTAEFAGQPYALNVWGTWCAGCRQEHATLMRIRKDNQLPIVGLNWRDERAVAIDYLTQYGDPFVAIGRDADGAAAIDWGVYGAPETFLIDAGGNVIYKHIGPLDYATWQREFINRLAAEAGG